MKILGVCIHKKEPRLVKVSTVVAPGIPKILITGVPASYARELKTKCLTVCSQLQLSIPKRKIVCSVSPPCESKRPELEFAILASILSVTGITPSTDLVLIGAMGIDGAVLPSASQLACALFADSHRNRVLVPKEVALTAAQFITTPPHAVASIRDYVALCTGAKKLTKIPKKRPEKIPIEPAYFSQICGQFIAKRALTIALAGKHNLLLVGPPGNGKTMLGYAAAELQPPHTPTSAKEHALVHSLATGSNQLEQRRPFVQAPHTCTHTELFGSAKTGRLGLLQQAHTGILFLDELPEFSKKTLASLCKPLEEKVLYSATKASACDCITIAAYNPCACGFAYSSTKECTCSEKTLQAYSEKISTPLKERFALSCKVGTIEPQAFQQNTVDINNEFHQLRQSIASVRKAKRSQRHLHLEKSAQHLLDKAHAKLSLSARAYFNCRDVAETIAMLEGAETISADHIAEALQFRIQ